MCRSRLPLCFGSFCAGRYAAWCSLPANRNRIFSWKVPVLRDGTGKYSALHPRPWKYYFPHAPLWKWSEAVSPALRCCPDTRRSWSPQRYPGTLPQSFSPSPSPHPQGSAMQNVPHHGNPPDFSGVLRLQTHLQTALWDGQPPLTSAPCALTARSSSPANRKNIVCRVFSPHPLPAPWDFSPALIYQDFPQTLCCSQVCRIWYRKAPRTVHRKRLVLTNPHIFPDHSALLSRTYPVRHPAV